jgi:hypothetical protein
MVQIGSTWEVRYSVPADAAEILESGPPAELLPFLAEIRTEPPPWRVEVVDEWIGIVREGLRGTPAILRGAMTAPEGVVLPRRDIPVYNYTRMIQVTNKIPMQSQAELMDGFNILAEWGANMALGLLAVEIRRPKGGSPILAGDVKVRVFDNKGAKVECDPKAPDTDGTVSYGNGDVSTAVIFFKIKTDHPESLAIVEATYKNKVHVLELRDAPRPYSGDN